MVKVITHAKQPADGEIIRRREDGLFWILIRCAGLPGITSDYYMVALCREFVREQGRKRETMYEWLSFRDGGQSFPDRESAIAYAQGA